MYGIIESETKYDEIKDELVTVNLFAYDDGCFEVEWVEGLNTINRCYFHADERAEERARKAYKSLYDEAFN